MTGQTSSPRRFAALMSATSARMKSSISATTASTVRPDASIRDRSARLISTVAAGMSAGIVSQCGRSVSWLMVVIGVLQF